MASDVLRLYFEVAGVVSDQSRKREMQPSWLMLRFLVELYSRFLRAGLPSRLAMVCFLWAFFSGFFPARAETGRIKKVIHQYALTSANDFPQRDPRDWRLLASNDGGLTWTTLDVRTDEVFQARQQRKVYPIDNSIAFETYRLQIDRVRDPNSASSVQLAEIELMGQTDDDRAPEPLFTDEISAQGDNPPAETTVNLFDGRVETKWLDWATNETTRSSWIQWRYGVPTETLVTNISQLLALRTRAGDGFPVKFEAVVGGWLRAGNRLCLVDATGCIELADLDGAADMTPGQKVLLTGASGWGDNQIRIRDGRVSTLGSTADTNPERISLGQPLLQGDDLRWVEIAGEIQYQHSTGAEISFDIQDGTSSMRVHLRDPAKAGPLPPSGTRVSVRGICLGAFDERGQWVAADLWAAGWDSLSMLDSRAVSELPPLASPRPVQALEAPPGTTTLTTIQQIRRLNESQIRSRPHVRIRGIVTDELEGFIQDNTAGIEVNFTGDAKRKITGLGDYIDVDGWAGLDDVGNPVVSMDQVFVLGRGKLPEPQRLTLSQLMSGRIDGQWIEVDGVVRSTDGSHLVMICDGRELMATMGAATDGLVNQLVDAEVRVRGVGVTAMDDEGRVQGIRLLIPSLEQVDVVAPPSDPRMLPVRKIGSLLGLNGPRESFHRVKVEGVVTLQENHKIFLRDDTGNAMAILKEDVMLDARFGHSRWSYWQTPATTSAEPGMSFNPGDRVEVVGFPETHRYSPVLTEVTLTKLGAAQPVKPVEITANGIEEGGLDSSLVKFAGILRGQTTIGAFIVLAVEWQDRTLQVMVPPIDGSSLKIPLGSRVQVTGICQVDPAPYPELGLGFGAVRFLARSPDDLVVLARPSWWTMQRALALIGGMTAILLGSLVWIKELRRQVGERTAQLSAEIELREHTERRHALDQERARIANDLHDDLGANLTQIIFLSERVEVARHDGQDVTHWFDRIPATARRTIQSLDEIVWAINPRHDSLESLANYLSQFAQEYLTLAGMRCVLDVPMVLPSVQLSAEVRHNLLLATREALQNSVTHGAATEVRLTLNLDENGVTITIADNGKGFDAGSVSSAGNGLRNIRRRLEAVGGRREITSRLGQGTVVTLFVPQKLLYSRVIDRSVASNQEL